MKRCLFCGQMNPDEATACYCGSSDLEVVEPVQNPAESAPPAPVPTKSRSASCEVKTYLAQAILTTLFCCMPFGIVAIVYASKVSAKLEASDQPGAVTASREALKWCWISFASGILLWIVLMIIGNLAEK